MSVLLILMSCLFAALPRMVMANDADLSGFDWESAGQIAVQDNGRIKPLDTFARELVAKIRGDSRFEGQPPVETYWRWMSDGELWSERPLVYLPHSDLRQQLRLNERQGNYFSLKELRASRALGELVMTAQAQQEAGEKLTFTQSKANELLAKLSLLGEVFTHERPLFVPDASGDPNGVWSSMPAALAMFEDSTLADTSRFLSEAEQVMGLAFAGMYNAIRDGRADIFNTSVRVYREAQAAAMQAFPASVFSRLKWELNYHALRPFVWAKILLAVGFLGYLLSLRPGWDRLQRGGLVALLLGFGFYTSGMVFRAYISGRAPWSNMYESLLAIGWAVVFIALIFESVNRERIWAMVGGALGAAGLMIAQFAGLDRGINPLVPALQSYWLNYHVIITLSGYACFAIAMGIGHSVLISAVRSRGEVTPKLAGLIKANLRIVQVGSLFLVTGILLGAVWANVSWGRFWGWDPKETWALICWFFYIVLLHGRSAGWLGWRGLAAYSIAGFPVVIMTYYGVNYYLSGLHSYGAGSSPGIPWQVFFYLGLEAAFLIWSLRRLRGTVPKRSPVSARSAGVVAKDTPAAANPEAIQ